MAKYIYPALFEPQPEGGYTITFPDIKHCLTQADDLQSGLDNAADVLALMLWQHEEDGIPINPPTKMEALPVNQGAFASLICADTLEYRKRYGKKTVKKH